MFLRLHRKSSQIQSGSKGRPGYSICDRAHSPDRFVLYLSSRLSDRWRNNSRCRARSSLFLVYIRVDRSWNLDCMARSNKAAISANAKLKPLRSSKRRRTDHPAVMASSVHPIDQLKSFSQREIPERFFVWPPHFRKANVSYGHLTRGTWEVNARLNGGPRFGRADNSC